jgi:hypothetical protein
MRNILIFLFFILLAACGRINYNTFSSEEHGFEIDYPANWDTTNMDSRMVFMALEGFKDSTDMYTEGFSISVYDNEGYDLESIVEQNVNLATFYFEDAKIEQNVLKTENGIEGIALELIYDAEGLEVMNRASFFDHAGKLYTITESMENKKRDEYDAIFNDIINSLTWKDAE